MSNTKNEHQRDFKGVWIPKSIWLDRSLTLTERVMLVEIDSLDNNDGCYAGNEYFATFFNLSLDRVKRIIASLKKKGYIMISIDNSSKNRNRRIIKILVKPGRKQPGGQGENNLASRVENAPYNNTDINNPINNPPTPQGDGGVAELIKVFIDAGSKIGYGNTTQRAAAARIIAEYGLDQALAMANGAVKLNGKLYAPVTTTPYELEKNLPKLRAFAERERQRSSKFSVGTC